MTAHPARSGIVLSLLVATAVVVTARPALAKGLESATIAGPGIDRPIELSDTPNLMVRLMEQTGLWYATGGLPPRERPGELGPGYTVTWINSGAPGESVDSRTIRQLIYLGAEDGPAIHTPAQDGLHGWEPGVTGWFVAPSGLRDTLAELAVPISAASSFSERPLSEASADGAQPERDPAGANSYAVAGFALVGLAAALVVRRMLEWRVRRCP